MRRIEIAEEKPGKKSPESIYTNKGDKRHPKNKKRKKENKQLQKQQKG